MIESESKSLGSAAEKYLLDVVTVIESKVHIGLYLCSCFAASRKFTKQEYWR